MAVPGAETDAQRTQIFTRVFEIAADVLRGDAATVYVFGSYARRQEWPSSDIDIAVDIGSPLARMKLLELKERYHDSTIPFRVDVVDFHVVDKQLRERILKEGVSWTEFS